MNLTKWKTLASKEREEFLASLNAQDSESRDLAIQVGLDFEEHCRWQYDKIKVLNRFGELQICIYLNRDDYEVAKRYPKISYLSFGIVYDSERNYIEN